MRDEVYDKLQHWIMVGKLEPGIRLRDQALSEALGISRTPIREALLKLEDDGLVITKANRWTIVSPIVFQEAANIYSVVSALETLALEEAFHQISSTEIGILENLNEAFNQTMLTGDKFAILQADNEFHDKIIQLSNNLELPKLLLSLKVKIRRIEVHYFSQNDTMLPSYKEHQQIIEALKKKNLMLAKDAIKANWKNSLERIRTKY
ncbi:GntR family transcriptional regulator [Peribacillus sp. SI8-4]|uniref:GntR family transcriptional regulator n=1 Tax=Peribacillus sp. SI8-4 TaxID=3048009 RepID=UPI00255377FF|nr:GntR family transcriptional regulator [Peribacillus sp. SI8-4]